MVCGAAATCDAAKLSMQFVTHQGLVKFYVLLCWYISTDNARLLDILFL